MKLPVLHFYSPMKTFIIVSTICISFTLRLFQEDKMTALYGIWSSYQQAVTEDMTGWKAYEKVSDLEALSPFTDYFKINKDGTFLWRYPGRSDSYVSQEGTWYKSENNNIVLSFHNEKFKDIVVTLKDIDRNLIWTKRK